MSRALALLALSWALAACTVSVDGPSQALLPEGEPVAVALASGATVEGELLVITDKELFLKEGGRLKVLGLGAARSVLLKRYGLSFDADLKEKLTLHARYPQGLTEQQWQLLLKEAGQSELLRDPG
jgi:hypothetical protein